MMSSNTEEEKDSPKAVPLDLARSQITSLRTIEGKAPLLMTNQSFRNMRVVAQGASIANTSTLSGPTIIATNLVSQAVLKPESTRSQITNIIATQPQITGNISRPSQITLSAATQAIGASYHVPRGPAVVANLAAPRSTVTTVRTPMVVTAQGGQTHSFVRPSRTPSPAQGTAWLTSSSSGTQIKGAPTVLSSPVRGATVTGKPQIISRVQPQAVSAIRPGTILQNAITLGQPGQIHSFKTGVTGIQALGNTVTIAQVLPSRTQTIVYGTSTTAQFTPTARITVANPNQTQRTAQPRPVGQNTTRLTVPVNVSQSGTRLVAPQATVLASGTRISTIPTSQVSNLGSTGRLVTTAQTNVNLGRLSVATATPSAVSSTNILGQTRISTLNLHSLVVANSSQARSIPAQGAKVITQPAHGSTLHLTPLTTPVKTTANNVSTTPRTISVPAAIVTQQRQATLVPSQAISIAKVFPQPENQGSSGTPSNVFIHAPVQPTVRRSSPSPSRSVCVTQQPGTSVPTTTVATYTLAGSTYFYDAAQQGRPFAQGQATFAPLPQTSQALVRPNANSHGILANQQMRFNSVVVVEPNRCASSQFQSAPEAAPEAPAQQPKVSSSPRPSILRKRDHEGSPLKAAKNLTPVLAGLPAIAQAQQLPMVVSVAQAPASPPSRPDSRGNGNSSGGSTTISATSSPGPVELNEDSNPGLSNVKDEEEEEEESKPPLEMSPRKKPRKQQLTGNDMDELNEDMQFICDNPAAASTAADDSDTNNQSEEPRDGAPEAEGRVTTVRKPVSASLLNSYRQNWKATHNHYLRHSDVKPKEERRPSIMDLANQCRVQEKVNGWKIHHLSTQMEDLAEQEQTVYDQLTGLLKCTESEMGIKHFDKELNRINDLIKGNLQRVKIINDGMIEAKTSIMKIFDHKVHVTDIINRCASKRSFKKREKC